MAAVEVAPIDTYYDAEGNAANMMIAQAIREARRKALFLRVEGWTMLWPLGIEGGELRAQCPTAPKVRPVVEVAEIEGAPKP